MKKTTAVLVGLFAAFAAGAAWCADDDAATVAYRHPTALIAGYRAMTLYLSGDQLQFLNKGDHVDALVTFEAKMKDNAKEKVTATILQNILILDVAKPVKPEDKGVVELVLNPNESQYLALSLQQGELRLVRRAEGDTELHPMEMASFRKLFR
jgi:Flp pilus assembly protein CpaB